MKHFAALFLAFLLIVPAHSASLVEGPIDNHELGYSTEISGRQPVWVLREFSDVPKDYWFYPALQKYRREGIVIGDQYGNVAMRRPVTAEEIYTFFVRYIYADDFRGTEHNGAIYGDYTCNGHTAWQDAYEEVATRLAETIKMVDHTISLPESRESQITRKRAFVLYCMAELSRCKDPVWYFDQFSDEYLGYFARSNAPIYTYETGQPVAGFFSASDHYQMTPLEIQSANMLMYLGVLNGTEAHTLAPDRIITRSEAIKLLAGVDLVDASPHLDDADDGDNGDWGGNAGEYPEPTPTPDPVHHEPVSILFMDWDNTTLGSLVVMSNQDVSDQVKEYVQRFIHPDLRGKAFSDDTRETNYRGKYNGYPDGAEYPLTAHLDYNFIGWTPCTIQNYMDVGTTVGVGELVNSYPALVDFSRGITTSIVCKAAYEPGPLLMTSEDAMYSLISPPDILFLEGKKIEGADDLAYVLPRESGESSGTQIPWGVNQNYIIIDVYFNFERVSYDASGQVHGVERARELAMDLRYETDAWYQADGEVHTMNERINEEGVYFNGSHAKVSQIPQGDEVRIRVQFSGALHRISYVLVDTYGANFVTGKIRSHNNEWYYYNEPEKYIPTNFNYLLADSDTSDEFYDCWFEDRHGTAGYVMTAFLRGLCLTSYLDYLDGVEDNLFREIHGCHFGDITNSLNIKYPGKEGNTDERSFWINAAYHAVCDIAENHYQEEGWWDDLRDMPSITLHQLQLFINDYASAPETAHVLPRDEAENILVSNCRIHAACQAVGK